MKKLLLIFLCLPMIGFGQGWIKNFNDSGEAGGLTVRQTTDGGYIIFGDNIIKTNVNGDTLWTRNYTGEDGFQTPDGGYMFCDSEYSSFVRMDFQGDTLWTKPFSGASIVNSDDGGFVFINSKCSGNPFTSEQNNAKFDKDCSQINLFKTDSLGNLLWNKTYFPEPIYGNNSAYKIVKTNDGGYMIFGRHPLGNLIKTNMNGDTLWTKGYNVGKTYSGNQTADGGYIITGEYDTINNGIQLGDEIYLVKTDSIGNQIFLKTYRHPNGLDEIWAGSVIETNDGGYVITTSIENNNFNYSGNIYVIKTDNIGDTIWTSTFCNPFCYAWAPSGTEQTLDGGYIITGLFWDGTLDSFNEPDSDGMSTILIKINHLGTLTSTQQVSIKNSNGKLINLVDILGRKTKPANNTPLFYIYDDGTVEKKIIIE